MSNESDAFHSQVNWDYLVDSIGDKKCVLVIGPELAKSINSIGLAQYIKQQCEKGNIPPPSYTSDGFLDFQADNKDLITFYIKKYYKETPVPDIYHTIAKLPFHLVIALSPDNFVRKAFKAAYPLARCYYFNKSKSAPIPIPPAMDDEPLVYNLMGDAELEKKSVVCTYEDLFTYVEKIFGNKGLPEELRLMLKEANNYVFLGVKFEGWYLKLLFRILEIHESQRNYASIKSGLVQLDDHIKTFYPKYFKINFIEDHEDSFVDSLVEECDQKMVVDNSSGQGNLRQMVQLEIVKEDGIENSIKILRGQLAIYDFDYDALTILEADYNELKSKITRGIVNEKQIEINKIRDRILEIAKNARRR